MRSSLQRVIVSRGIFAFAYHILLPTMPLFLLAAPFELSLSQLAWALAAYGLSDRGIALLCPPLVERLGTRNGQIVGTGVTGIALLYLATAPSFTWVIVALIVLGAGNSLSGLACRVFISSAADNDARLQSFSRLYIAYNCGAAVGVLVPFVFSLQRAGPLLLVIAAVLNFVAAVLVLRIDDPKRNRETKAWRQLYSTIRDGRAREVGALHGVRYCSYTLLMVFLFVQSFELLPVYFEKTTGVWSHWGWVFALNTIMIVALQGKVTKIFKSFIQQQGDLPYAFGALCMAAGALIMALCWYPWASFGLMVVFTMSEMIVAPHTEYAISTYVDQSLRSVFYALNITGVALGRAAAGFLGIRYLDHAVADDGNVAPWWWSMAAVALLWAAGIYIGNRRRKA